MTIETATYISDLNASYPAASDLRSEGDDHMRLIKSTVKATFPNVAGAVTPTHTELNYVDGVTSAIQTQLDAKIPSSSSAVVLDSKGIRQPLNPYAVATKSSWLGYTVNDRITGFTEVLDNSSSFASDRFTAPVAGIYEVIAFASSSSDLTALRPYVNGSYSSGYGSGAASGSAYLHTFLSLSASDYVDMYAYGASVGGGTISSTVNITWVIRRAH